MKKYITWEYVKRTMDIIQCLTVVFGVCFTVFQIQKISNDQLDKKYTRSLIQYDRLNTGINKKISLAIENKQPILQPKGKFTPDELDEYLNDLYSVGQSLDKNLVDKEIVCSDFYDLSMNAHNHKEVTDYIQKSRTDTNDDTYFYYADYLYDSMKSCE